MATRLSEPAKARKSLPLTERDLADLERLRGQTPERDALAELVGMEVQSVTEAALLPQLRPSRPDIRRPAICAGHAYMIARAERNEQAPRPGEVAHWAGCHLRPSGRAGPA